MADQLDVRLQCLKAAAIVHNAGIRTYGGEATDKAFFELSDRMVGWVYEDIRKRTNKS